MFKNSHFSFGKVFVLLFVFLLSVLVSGVTAYPTISYFDHPEEYQSSIANIKQKIESLAQSLNELSLKTGVVLESESESNAEKSWLNSYSLRGRKKSLV